MNKYDKMLELNKRKSEEKVERAILAIRTLSGQGKQLFN